MRYNAEARVRQYLADALPDATVRVSVPNPIPDGFIYVRQEDGRALDKYRALAGIGLFVWADTEAKACALATRAAKYMQELAYTNGVAKVVEENFMSSPAPENQHPRWYASYTLTTYEITE